MKSTLLAVALILNCTMSSAQTIVIEPGNKYQNYSNEELRRRVYDLERAVAKLQDQVFQLATGKPHAESQNLWTCQMQAFGTTFVASGTTKASALAQVMKKCSDKTNAIHCGESNAKCDNQ